MSDDLRTLAQAVVDAWRDRRDDKPQRALALALNISEDGDVVTAAEAILAVDAQGCARAMGEVVTLCGEMAEAIADRQHLHSAQTQQGVIDDVADWARERLPAAAEKEHGGWD